MDRHGEDHVEIGDRQQLFEPVVDPLCAGCRLTGRAMAVTARIVRDLFMSATIAAIYMSAQRGCVAGEKRIDNAIIMPRQRAMLRVIFVESGTEDIGKFQGMLYNLAADTLGASISFYLGRYFLHGVARGFLETRMPWLDRKTAEEGFTVIFYLRIFWFPFIVLNYAAGATRIRFRDYLLGTVLGLLPPVFIFTYFVGSMKEVLATYRRPIDLLTFDLLFPVLLLILSFFLPTLLKRLRKGRELLPPAGQP